MADHEDPDQGLQIVYRNMKDLVPYARNARIHPPSQRAVIRTSLLEYGWTLPLAIADNGMLAGHGRLQVAMELAKEGVPIPRNPDPWSCPTVDLSHLSAEQRRAYIIMDNKSSLGSLWDEEMLPMELGDLLDEDVDLKLAGFSQAEIDRLLDGPEPKEEGGEEAGSDEEPEEKLKTCPACGFILSADGAHGGPDERKPAQKAKRRKVPSPRS